MSSFEFFYADIAADEAIINNYSVGDWMHANNGIVASRLKGGLLTNCNVRFSFLPHPQGSVNYRLEDQDYMNQQLIVFNEDLNYKVIDKFRLQGYTQILMSPVNDIEDYGIDSIVRAARHDFNQLLGEKPVAALDTSAWKRKVATVPGINCKNNPRKGFLTVYWK